MTAGCFSQPLLLMGVERGLLHAFLERFQKELEAVGLILPDPTLPHDEYSRALSRLTMGQDGMPDALCQALYEVEEMAQPEGRERLQEAVGKEMAAGRFRADSSDLDFAIQVWLHCPRVFRQKRAENQMARLCVFEYFSVSSPASPPLCSLPPDQAVMDRLIPCIDAWHALHMKGVGTTQIDVHFLDAEYWFVIRHGDGCVRVPATGLPQRHVMHYRPERDDVVVYSPEFNELRLNVRTRGEARLYREAVGLHLFGDHNHFSEEKVYTLEPLRTLRERVLDATGVEGVRRIVLSELHVQAGDGESHPKRFTAADLFDFSRVNGLTEDLFPAGYVISQAMFDFHFDADPKPRGVHVCPPNKLRLARHCDVRPVHRWLSIHGMKLTPSMPQV